MLPVSLDCLLLIATSVFCIVFLFCLSSFRLVPNVACIFGFSIIDQTEVKINNREYRDTSNIGHTTHRKTTIKAKEQHSKQKGQSIINNPEIQATLGFDCRLYLVLCAQCCLYLWIVYY
jgi:hypothetical protein